MTSPHPDAQPQADASAPGATGAGSPGGAAATGGTAAEGTATGGTGTGGAYQPDRKVATRDQARLSLTILRDVALASIILSLFAAAESWATVSRLALATTLAVIDGLLAGIATGALAHEWGHFIGARLGGGHAPLRPLTNFPPLYDFDYANNDSRAFLWMSYGGNVAHAVLVLVYLMLVPTRSMGTAALVAGAFGFGVFSSLIEFPVIRQAQRGVPALEALAVIPKNFVSRYLPWSVAAAFAAYAAL
jgi:hypothetical protein